MSTREISTDQPVSSTPSGSPIFATEHPNLMSDFLANYRPTISRRRNDRVSVLHGRPTRIKVETPAEQGEQSDPFPNDICEFIDFQNWQLGGESGTPARALIRVSRLEIV
ncbi:hypothetical protein [Nocardia bovistercoris]|uniref:Uncharacterized protein n=1 Tax=Nocardia bovistercoris TaxID=2785916 RepID=A0A931N4Y7_9NOCA|nr:hypothetical protein [Nocardia bovistercoris]MBH0779197.1 hypothetical protein [Nocardia bovistercoris]